MRRIISLLVGAFLLASCAPEPAPVPTGTPPLPSATPVLHAPEIRFALIGEPRDVNVWELFDQTGASYADYALRSEYWPRLYHLVPPDFSFEPQAARDMPSTVTQDGEFYSATVFLRDDLKWTDGAPFTADDVAFTVNTALTFELGFDWGAYYPVEYLERAEAVDDATVKFIFKRQPNVGVWQYGALQGPIIQKAFWEPKIVEAAALLPDQSLRQALKDAGLQLQNVQTRVNDLTTQSIAMASVGQDNREVLLELQNQQNNLIFAQNTLNKLVDEVTAKFQSARGALYEVDDEDEPTLGTWMPAGKQNGLWVNEANLDFPFIKPNFDRVVYTVFRSSEEAFDAIHNNKVDLILSLDEQPLSADTDVAVPNLDGSVSFLVFNTTAPILSDPTLRQAISCMIAWPDRSLFAPRGSFVLQNNVPWHNFENAVVCGNSGDQGLELMQDHAVQLLKSAGYSWETEPTVDSAGSGLIAPDGRSFPSLTLLGPPDINATLDPLEANVIAQQLSILGLSVVVKDGTPEDTRYAVFSSTDYDMAIVNWNLSLYPGYLCDWFGPGGQFEYGRESLRSECEALAVTSDLEAARAHVFQIQSILMEDLPFIPLYSDIRYDAYRNVRYPFENVLGGLGGLYGAPSYAIPAP